MDFINLYDESAKTTLGFCWKSGRAFVLGYFVSRKIQVFVPQKELPKYMGKANLQSISLSTFFGAVFSSCSFAALTDARW